MADSLSTSEKKLQILDQQRLSIAVEDYVTKEQKGTIGETVGKIISGQQKKLVKRGLDFDEDSNDGNMDTKVSTANAVREACQAKPTGRNSFDSEEEISAVASVSNLKRTTKSTVAMAGSQTNDDSDDEIEMSQPKRARMAAVKGKGSRAMSRKSSRASADVSEDDHMEDDEDLEPSRKPKVAPKRRAARATTAKRKRYTVDDEDDDEFVDDDSDVEIVEKPSSRRKPAARSRTESKRSRTATKSSYTEESDDDDVGWGTANTMTSASQRSRRR